MPERATTCTTSQDLISTPRRRDENETPTNNILAIIFLQYISLSRLLQFKSKSGIQYEARPPRRKKNKKTLRHQCTNKYISQETIKKSIILALYSTIFFSQKIISSFPMKNIFSIVIKQCFFFPQRACFIPDLDLNCCMFHREMTNFLRKKNGIKEEVLDRFCSSCSL